MLRHTNSLDKNLPGKRLVKPLRIKDVKVRHDISKTITSILDRSNDELLHKTQAQLEEYWYFSYMPKKSLESNLYSFYEALKLYGSFCRRWEEAHNGTCCVVERVRDTYLLPKIRQAKSWLQENL